MSDDRMWRDLAACLDEDSELFFPIGTSPALQRIAEAKAVCHTCSVRDTCLTWALDTHQDYGILGGLTEDERRTLKHRNRRATTRARKAAEAAEYAERCQNMRVRVSTLTTRGQSAREIARTLGISERTAGRYRASAKAGVA